MLGESRWLNFQSLAYGVLSGSESGCSETYDHESPSVLLDLILLLLLIALLALFLLAH